MPTPKRPLCSLVTRRRKTSTIDNTARRVEAQLDGSSVVAIDYARAALMRFGALDPTGSGVIRRALDVYVRHLQGADLNREHEVLLMRSACRGSCSDPEALAAALERIGTVPEGDPLPEFVTVLLGPEARERHARLMTRVEELVAEMEAEMEDEPAARKRTSRKKSPAEAISEATPSNGTAQAAT